LLGSRPKRCCFGRDVVCVLCRFSIFLLPPASQLNSWETALRSAIALWLCV
jgi:hypothetical protein